MNHVWSEAFPRIESSPCPPSNVISGMVLPDNAIVFGVKASSNFEPVRVIGKAAAPLKSKPSSAFTPNSKLVALDKSAREILT